jgi:dienelactone hydrolase
VGAPSVYLPGLESAVALDGPPVSGSEHFPLIVFSHGNSGVRYQSFFLAEALASHGFVVVAPDHTGNTIFEPGATFETRDRPLDVSFLITRMLEKSGDTGDRFYRRIDPSRIGVTGHSFGAFTALALAGGFTNVPIDPRVRAILPFATWSDLMDDVALAAIRVPTLILGGTRDTITPIVSQSTRPFELIPAVPRYRVDLIDGGHNSFTNICDILDVAERAGAQPALLSILRDHAQHGCAPELIPVDEAHRTTILYAVAFLKRFVADDSVYEGVLTPKFAEAAEIPVTFTAIDGSTFIRSDSNADSTIDIADAIFTLSYLFAEGATPTCLDAADANDDGAVDIADAIAVLSHLFAGSGDLPEPFGECGVDPTVDELGCVEYPGCE